jgi:RNA polymerase sigma-70 factor (sigma-E family)
MERSSGRAPARQEFDQFVAEAADKLVRAAYLITWDLADAEDLVQECLFKVARRWPRVRKMDHPFAYARTVLVHLALDEGKHRTRRRAELTAAAATPLEQLEDDAALRVLGRVEASADLIQALAALPPRQRAAVVLRYFEDLSEMEVAEAMGCSVGTVKSTTSRALERLRRVVDFAATPTTGDGCANGSGNGSANGKATTNVTNITDLPVQNDTCVVAREVSTSEGSIT